MIPRGDWHPFWVFPETASYHAPLLTVAAPSPSCSCFHDGDGFSRLCVEAAFIIITLHLLFMPISFYFLTVLVFIFILSSFYVHWSQTGIVCKCECQAETSPGAHLLVKLSACISVCLHVLCILTFYLQPLVNFYLIWLSFIHLFSHLTYLGGLEYP